MASHVLSKVTIEVNPKRSYMTVLKGKAAVDEPDKVVQDLIWLFLDALLLASSSNLDGPRVLATSEYGWSANTERILKAQASTGSFMTSYMVSKKTMEVNPRRTIMTSLRRKAAADESDETVKDFIWLLFYTLLLASGFNLDGPTQFAGRIHRTIELGLSIDDVGEGLGDDDVRPRSRWSMAPLTRPPRWRRPPLGSRLRPSRGCRRVSLKWAWPRHGAAAGHRGMAPLTGGGPRRAIDRRRPGPCPGFPGGAWLLPWLGNQPARPSGGGRSPFGQAASGIQ